jgi:hypothetical protein
MSHVAQMPSPSAAPADRPGFDRLWHPRGTLCAVCMSRTRGYGWFDPHRSRRKRTPRWFCSPQCQSAFTRKAKKGLTMIGITNEERLAIAMVLKRIGNMMELIGWDKRLCDLTEIEMTALIEEILEIYSAEMSRFARTQEVPF